MKRLPLLAFLLLVFLPNTTWAQSLTLTWTDNSNDEVGFTCERQTGGGAFLQVCDVGTNVALYADSTVSFGVSYCYRVRAYNAVGTSTYSSTVCATPVATTATLSQVSHRIECFGGTEANPDCVRDPTMAISPGGCVRVRAQVSNTAGASESLSTQLYAKPRGGAYAVVPNGPCTSTGICFATSRPPPELTAGSTSERLDGAGTFVASSIQLNASATNPVAFAVGQDTELLAALCVGFSTTVGNYFDLQWRRFGGQVLETYTQTPRIKIGGYSMQYGARCPTDTVPGGLNGTCSFATPVVVPPALTGLVLAMNLNATAGTVATDSSGSSNNGTLTNGPVWTVSGKYAGGLSFDGTDDFVSVPDAATLDLGTTGTLEAWAKFDVINRWNGVFAKGTVNDGPPTNYWIEVSDTNLAFCGIGDGATFQAISTAISGAGVWQHLACTWDASTIKLYKDGALTTSAARTVVPTPNAGPLNIGQFGGGVDRLDGTLDDVRVWSVARTAAEIVTDRDTPIP